MMMFFPSTYPSSRNPCRNASTSGSVGDPPRMKPIVGIFFGCWASAITATASSTATTRIDGTAAFSIAHLVSSVIYHADRDKGKCDLHGGRRQVLIEWEGQNQPEIAVLSPEHPRIPTKPFGCLYSR